MVDVYAFQSITKEYIYENWPVFTSDGKVLEPRKYQEGKDQADIVYELLYALERNKVVVLETAPGTGKSLIGLVTAWFLVGENGKVVVNCGPYKHLQLQYLQYFTKFRIGDWKAGIIWGRPNYLCAIARCTCAEAPCLKARKMSEAVKVCPYYTPPVRETTLSQIRRYVPSEKIEIVAEWETIDGDKVYLISRDGRICPYYRQFMHYADSNVIVLNYAMWFVDTLRGRRVKADLDIVDEFDHVFKSYHPQATLDQEVLSVIESAIEESMDKELKKCLKEFVKDVKKTLKTLKFEKRLDYVRDLHDSLARVLDYIFDLLDLLNLDSVVVRKLQNLAWFVKHHEKASDVLVIPDPLKGSVSFISLKPSNYFKWLFRNSNKILLMSATPLDRSILGKVYGFDKLAWVRGPSKCYGTVYVGGFGGMQVSGKLLRTGKKSYVEEYARAFVSTILMRRVDGFDPGLIIIWSKLHENILRELNHPIVKTIVFDSDGSKLKEFIEGKISEVATTRASRGVDLPGNKCRSIVISKAPFPDISSPIWRAYYHILSDEEFKRAYRAEALNNLLQIIARALREENDWVWIYSPDKTVEEMLNELSHEGKISVAYERPPITREIFRKVTSDVEKKGYAILNVREYEGKCKWYGDIKVLKEKLKYIAERYLNLNYREYDVCKDIVIFTPKNLIIEGIEAKIEEEIKTNYADVLAKCVEEEELKKIEEKVEEKKVTEVKSIEKVEEKVVEEKKEESESEAKSVEEEVKCKVFFMQDYGSYKRGDEVELPYSEAIKLHSKGVATILCFDNVFEEESE